MPNKFANDTNNVPIKVYLGSRLLRALDARAQSSRRERSEFVRMLIEDTVSDPPRQGSAGAWVASNCQRIPIRGLFVYFLMRGPEIVYVGRCTKGVTRACGHPELPVDRSFALEVEDPLTERALIRCLKPRWNIHTATSDFTTEDQAILEANLPADLAALVLGEQAPRDNRPFKHRGTEVRRELEQLAKNASKLEEASAS